MLQKFIELRQCSKNKLKSARSNLASIQIRLKKAKTGKQIINYTKQQAAARRKVSESLRLHQNITTLCSWTQHDILVVPGVCYEDRLDLLLFVAEELQKMESPVQNKIKAVRKTLQKNATKLLGFVKTLEAELETYAAEIGCDVYWLWEVCNLQRYSKTNANYYQHAMQVQTRFGRKFRAVELSVIAIMEDIEKASSVVENLNGRIRKFLRITYMSASHSWIY